MLPEGFPLLPLDFGRAGGVEESLVAHSVHRSSLLSPRFLRGLEIQELPRRITAFEFISDRGEVSNTREQL